MNFRNVFIIFAIFGNLLFFLSGCNREVRKPVTKDEPQVVQTLTTAFETVTLSANLNGVVQAYERADIRPQVSGIIREQYFSGGEMVKKGDPLYLIDDRPFKNKYDYALATYHKELAKYELMDLKLKRYSNLSLNRAVSIQEYEDVKALFAECKAQVEIAKSNLEDAKLNLEYTKVLSPIDGIVGLSTVTKGALVTANQSSALTSVTSISKVYVDLQESSYDYRRNLMKIKNNDLMLPKDGIKAFISVGKKRRSTLEGDMKFYDVMVDESTGNLTMRTLFDNPERILLPGMNVTASVTLGVMQNALVLPEKALSREARGDVFVFVVKDGEVVKQKVVLRSLPDGRYLVEEGLGEGEKVVISGKKLLKNHTRVIIKD